MHKGYKCLDRSTGHIYISRDVIFDEYVFPFATPGVTVDVSTLDKAISFLFTEPATSAHVRSYDLTYLATNPSGLASVSPVQAPRSATLDVHAMQIDVHGGQASQAGVPPAHAAGSFYASPASKSVSPAREIGRASCRERV